MLPSWETWRGLKRCWKRSTIFSCCSKKHEGSSYKSTEHRCKHKHKAISNWGNKEVLRKGETINTSLDYLLLLLSQ